ncbi:MAG: vWA domain-containing protein [Desulfobacterales bacterium]
MSADAQPSRTMFIAFFYALRDAGIPVSPTAFLTLQRALSNGLVSGLDGFYTASRAILVKSERYFDRFDQIFAHFFRGAELPDSTGLEIDDLARLLLEEWLDNPQVLADALGMDESQLARLTPEELLDYFKARLADQDGEHHGGNRWIGTGGTSPVGHSGFHPGGMRVGGVPRNRSAVKVALERRYRDYSLSGPLKATMMREAMKRLRHLVPAGPKDRLDVDATLYQTMKNAGEIELVFDRDLRDRLKVILAIDNGGWSMDPYVPLVQALFDQARDLFKDLKTYYFHNTVYDVLWKDPTRYREPQSLEAMAGFDPETRMFFVGDASMAPYELMAAEGSIYVKERSGQPSIERLRFLARSFPKSVWLNPVPVRMWEYTPTISRIREVFPMFELTVDGIEAAVSHLQKA